MQFDEQKKQFESEGYAIFDDFYPQRDLVAFRKVLEQTIRIALDRAHDKDKNFKPVLQGREIEEGLLALRYFDPNYVAFIQRVVSRSPEFFHLSSNLTAADRIRSLLGLKESAPLYIVSNGVIFTNPRDSANKRSSNFELDWHKDIFYTIPKSRYAHIWVPLIYDATEEIGTLQVLPGSHKQGMGQQRINIHTDYNHRYTMAPESIERFKAKSVEVKLGQALIFDYRLAHRSGQNISDRVRCTMLGLIHDASNPDFLPVSTHYSYYGQTPEGYFAEVFNDADARSLKDEQAACPGEPKGGV